MDTPLINTPTQVELNLAIERDCSERRSISVFTIMKSVIHTGLCTYFRLFTDLKVIFRLSLSSLFVYTIVSSLYPAT